MESTASLQSSKTKEGSAAPANAPVKLLLKCGATTLVDYDLADYLNQWKWHLGNHGYVCRGERDHNGVYRQLLLHRVVNETPRGIQVDHINGNRRDNRKANLRLANRNENAMNQHRTGSSGYKGVSWDKDQNRWRVHVMAYGVIHYVGRFDNVLQAAQARDAFALEKHGEFATRNF